MLHSSHPLHPAFISEHRQDVTHRQKPSSKSFLSKTHALPVSLSLVMTECTEFKDTDSCKSARVCVCVCVCVCASVFMCVSVCPFSDPGLRLVLPNCLWMPHMHKKCKTVERKKKKKIKFFFLMCVCVCVCVCVCAVEGGWRWTGRSLCVT